MSNGYLSPSLPLGMGVPAPIGKGRGPLPFLVGVPSVELVGKGNGPLPFITGVQVTELVGKGHGPFPFILGSLAASTGEYGGKRFDWDRRSWERLRHRILREDEEMLEIVIELLLSGVIE